jgi:hypothetical protein
MGIMCCGAGDDFIGKQVGACPLRAVTGLSGCAWRPCSWLSGAVAGRARGAVPVAYVLQDLLTTTGVRTRMAQLGIGADHRQTRFTGAGASPLLSAEYLNPGT